MNMQMRLHHLATSSYFWSYFPLKSVGSASQEDLDAQEINYSDRKSSLM